MKPSAIQRSFARRTFFQALGFSTLLFLVVAGFYWLAQPVGTPPKLLDYASIFLFLLLYGMLPWMFQKNTLAKLNRQLAHPPTAKQPLPDSAPQTEADRTRRDQHEKRLFVHLVSVLQREGRLVDFFQEDLQLYDDAQIGAAVRSIHENCKKTLDRYLSIEPVMRRAEGEPVDIDAGFDPHAVKLVGNVVGRPPFSGVVRHRGWQLRAITLPKLAEAGNPDILAPAEVEIE